MTISYTRDGSPDFNQWLDRIFREFSDEVAQVLGDNLVALVLGGGYGRGEGGLVVANGQERPYNDLDFTLIVKNKSSLPMQQLDAIRGHHAKELGIHVDFSRPLTLRDVERWPPWLVWYDLVNGHVVLKGPQDILKRHAPSVLQKPLPLIEATHLLLNRGTGVLWAMAVLRGIQTTSEEDFVRRNFYKCALSLGDALLIAYGRFQTAYFGRDRILNQVADEHPDVAAFGLQGLYEKALHFKFRPDAFVSENPTEKDLEDLAHHWGAVFLHVEKRRTGRSWKGLDDYVCWKGLREPEEHALKGILRNILRNRQLGTWGWRYPRESLYRRLPVLLGLTRESAADWPGETVRFLQVWDRFN